MTFSSTGALSLKSMVRAITDALAGKSFNPREAAIVPLGWGFLELSPGASTDSSLPTVRVTIKQRLGVNLDRLALQDITDEYRFAALNLDGTPNSSEEDGSFTYIYSGGRVRLDTQLTVVADPGNRVGYELKERKP